MDDFLNAVDLEKVGSIIVVAFIFQVIIKLLFANTIRVTLKRVRKANQCIMPNQAWFLAIPLFDIYWNFVVVRRLADSLNNEFYDRKIAVEENPTAKQGYWFAGSNLAANFPTPFFVRYLLSVLSLVSFVVYWVKINEYRKLLKTTSASLEVPPLPADDAKALENKD